MKAASAGAMDYRMAFDAPVQEPNGRGGTINGWAERLQAFAAVTFLRGGEAVLGARLLGEQPVVVVIRFSGAAAEIRPSWRMRDVRSGVEFAIKGIVPSDDRAFWHITAISGVVA